eukprot:TRINITY_DN23013_c0_g1_i3.p1 TRINITY_DN23013_c0_g1~~TRINITY_DN23013_c0_g1_i3.p1  ORF type:complete len:914 (-),score=177.27 TRINITY_DN23013_c0_g1_i3:125-2866(-)
MYAPVRSEADRTPTPTTIRHKGQEGFLYGSALQTCKFNETCGEMRSRLPSKRTRPRSWPPPLRGTSSVSVDSSGRITPAAGDDADSRAATPSRTSIRSHSYPKSTMSTAATPRDQTPHTPKACYDFNDFSLLRSHNLVNEGGMKLTRPARDEDGDASEANMSLLSYEGGHIHEGELLQILGELARGVIRTPPPARTRRRPSPVFAVRELPSSEQALPTQPTPNRHTAAESKWVSESAPVPVVCAAPTPCPAPMAFGQGAPFGGGYGIDLSLNAGLRHACFSMRSVMSEEACARRELLERLYRELEQIRERSCSQNLKHDCLLERVRSADEALHEKARRAAQEEAEVRSKFHEQSQTCRGLRKAMEDLAFRMVEALPVAVEPSRGSEEMQTEAQEAAEAEARLRAELENERAETRRQCDADAARRFAECPGEDHGQDYVQVSHLDDEAQSISRDLDEICVAKRATIEKTRQQVDEERLARLQLDALTEETKALVEDSQSWLAGRVNLEDLRSSVVKDDTGECDSLSENDVRERVLAAAEALRKVAAEEAKRGRRTEELAHSRATLEAQCASEKAADVAAANEAAAAEVALMRARLSLTRNEVQDLRDRCDVAWSKGWCGRLGGSLAAALFGSGSGQKPKSSPPAPASRDSKSARKPKAAAAKPKASPSSNAPAQHGKGKGKNKSKCQTKSTGRGKAAGKAPATSPPSSSISSGDSSSGSYTEDESDDESVGQGSSPRRKGAGATVSSGKGGSKAPSGKGGEAPVAADSSDFGLEKKDGAKTTLRQPSKEEMQGEENPRREQEGRDKSLDVDDVCLEVKENDETAHDKGWANSSQDKVPSRGTSNSSLLKAGGSGGGDNTSTGGKLNGVLADMGSREAEEKEVAAPRDELRDATPVAPAPAAVSPVADTAETDSV